MSLMQGRQDDEDDAIRLPASWRRGLSTKERYDTGRIHNPQLGLQPYVSVLIRTSF